MALFDKLVLCIGIFVFYVYASNIQNRIPIISGSLYDVVNEEEEFILFSLLKQSGLSDLLSKPGSLTIFGPTDDAFLSLPEDIRSELSSDNKTLYNVLSFHVLNESVNIESLLINDKELTTLNGKPLRINIYRNKSVVTLSGKRLKLNVVDIQASNGMFNMIDDVMFPPIGDVAYTASQNQEVKTFTTLIMESGIYTNLTGDGPFTIFAPTDITFSYLPSGAIDKLLQNIPVLTDLLFNHIVPGTYYKEGLTTTTLKTINGRNLSVTEDLQGIKVNGSNFVTFDISATNGVIHTIDSVLQPPTH